MKIARSCIAVYGVAIAMLSCRLLRADDEPRQAPSGLALAAAMEQSLQSAIAKAEKSVVAVARLRKNRDTGDIQSSDLRGLQFGSVGSMLSDSDPTHPDFVPTDFGTGVVIDKSGLILTTCDVLGDLEEYTSNEYYVTAVDRTVRPAKVAAADPRSNLAVLKVNGGDLAPITFGDGGNLRKGQIVISLGNPYAIARDGQVSASWGIVSNLQRKAGRSPDDPSPSRKSTLHHLGTLIQTDAKLNLGTSGGALLNLQGEMVGLTTSMAAAAGYEQAAGYAIPIDDTFRRILDELRSGKAVQYGFLGVMPETSSFARQFDQPGVSVKVVVPGAPADRSGIHAGDLITHVNGKPVYDFDSLVLHVGSQPAGQQVELNINRGGRVHPLKAILAKSPVVGKPIVTNREPAWRGIRVDYWTAVVDLTVDRDQTYAIDEEGCVVVTEVEPDSPAAKAGLKPHVAITHVDGARISSPKDFLAAVNSLTGSVTVRIAGSANADRNDVPIAAE